MLHRVPVSIVSDQDSLFVSQFWKSLHEALGTRVDFNMAHHSQSDGQLKISNQIHEDML